MHDAGQIKDRALYSVQVRGPWPPRRATLCVGVGKWSGAICSGAWLGGGGTGLWDILSMVFYKNPAPLSPHKFPLPPAQPQYTLIPTP